ncbi:hypothetical protein E4U43_000418 [Claviceps pusilla]|uniref:DUF7918 domain-containing protein n=1 Tax=Claviceps pusilla TaxID=123648 RepID=A0A9P7NA82_9HYPO|nr:hypothetical protein E4U43_000418 [Claviceps pusilla]
MTFDVYVFVNGQPAKEYRLPQRQHGGRAPAHHHPTVHTNECYIESQSGQSYTVEVDVWLNAHTRLNEAVLCTLSVDGQKVQARIVEDNGPRRLPGAPVYETLGLYSWPRRCSFAGRYGLSATSQGVTREKLVFAPVTAVEETSKTTLERDAKLVAGLGTIEMEISACTVTGYHPLQVHGQAGNEKPFIVAEKSMKGKAISHGTTFAEGDIVSVSALPVSCEIRDVRPLAKFIFHYRSRRPTVSEEVLSMREDEVRSLAEKYLRVKREQQQIKWEEKPSVGFKRTIDLTGNDEGDDDVVEVPGKVKVLKVEDDGKHDDVVQVSGKVQGIKSEGGCDTVDLT